MLVLMMGAGRAARARLPLARPRTGGVPRLLALRLKLPLSVVQSQLLLRGQVLRDAQGLAARGGGSRPLRTRPLLPLLLVVVPHALSRVPVPSRLARDRIPVSLALTVGGGVSRRKPRLRRGGHAVGSSGG